MSDELIEKVARVLANAMGEIGDDVWKFYLREADAAIALVSGEQADRIEQLEGALREVMVGGNHLATIIGATHPQAGTHHAAALEFYGPGHQYDAWCCWNAIMAARAALGEERT